MCTLQVHSPSACLVVVAPVLIRWDFERKLSRTLQGKREAFFSQYAKTNAGRMRRGKARQFRVCVPAFHLPLLSWAELSMEQNSVLAKFADFGIIGVFLEVDPWEIKELLVMSNDVQSSCWQRNPTSPKAAGALP